MMRFLVTWLAEKLEWDEDQRTKLRMPLLIALALWLVAGALITAGLAYLCSE